MDRLRRLSAITIILGLVFVVFVVPAVAQDDSGDEPVQISSDSEPAVTVTTPPASDASLDWTYRYMIPTALAIAVVVILITSIQYFMQVVRKRYRTVEE